MKKQNGILIAACLVTLSVTAPLTIQAADAPPARELPGVMMGGESTATATVESVDMKTRKFTLRAEDGTLLNFVAGDDVRNLAQVKVGDRVVASYQVGLIMALAPSNSGFRERSETTEMGRTELGQKPGGVLRKTIRASATVRAIDLKKRTVTLQGPLQTVTLPVAADIDLGKIKVGDQVDAAYRETLAISVQPAPAAPGK